jgi:aldehyde dehydrogenase (NAD+)
MRTIKEIYINGEFVAPKGTQIFDLINPTSNIKEAEVVLGNEEDVQLAVEAAKEALKAFSQTSKKERIQYLKQL